MSRRRLDAEQSKSLILDAVERLMRKDGYTAVSTRAAAMEAGIKPTLVHYHFETTENLLLASYRRSSARSEALLNEALRSRYPLHALWSYNCDRERTALATQFMALAHLRPGIRKEMRENVERYRQMQSAAIDAAVAKTPSALQIQADALAMLIAAVGRAFVMETSIGISGGHEEMRRQVEDLLAMIEPVGDEQDPF